MKNTTRSKLFLALHGAVIGSIAAVVSSALWGWSYSPLTFELLVIPALAVNAKYGISTMNNFADLKAGLQASIAWPHTLWKVLDRKYQEPNDTIYDVFVNDVVAGIVTDDEYMQIKRDALHDPRVYFAQITNTLKIITKAVDSFVIGVPLMAFWGLIVLAYYEPSVYTSFIQAIQQGPANLTMAVSRYFWLLVLLWGLALIVQSVITMRVPGFENKFDQAVAKRLRHYLGVAAEVDVKLIPQGQSPIRAIAQS